jgi:hypothetical protein
VKRRGRAKRATRLSSSKGFCDVGWLIQAKQKKNTARNQREKTITLVFDLVDFLGLELGRQATQPIKVRY